MGWCGGRGPLAAHQTRLLPHIVLQQAAEHPGSSGAVRGVALRADPDLVRAAVGRDGLAIQYSNEASSARCGGACGRCGFDGGDRYQARHTVRRTYTQTCMQPCVIVRTRAVVGD